MTKLLRITTYLSFPPMLAGFVIILTSIILGKIEVMVMVGIPILLTGGAIWLIGFGLHLLGVEKYKYFD